MFWFGHLAAGYLIALLFTSKLALSAYQLRMLLILGTLFGSIPDFDIILFFFKNKSLKLGTNGNTHRDYITHAPMIWMFIGLLIYFLSTDAYIKHIGILLWFCTWAHFALDSIEYGIMWLWPFTNKRFMLKEVPDEHPKTKKARDYYKSFFKDTYSKTLTFYLEILIVAAAVATLILR